MDILIITSFQWEKQVLIIIKLNLISQKHKIFHFSVRHGFLDPLHPKTWGALFYVRAKGIDTSVLRRTLHSSPGIYWQQWVLPYQFLYVSLQDEMSNIGWKSGRISMTQHWTVCKKNLFPVTFAFDGRQSTFVFGCLSTATSYRKLSVPPPYTPRIPPPPPPDRPQRIPRTVPSLHPRKESCWTHRSLQNPLLSLVQANGPEGWPYPYRPECDISVRDPGGQSRVTAIRGIAAVEKT